MPVIIGDFHVFSGNKEQPEIAHKSAVVASLAVENGITPCIPCHVSDAGMEQPAIGDVKRAFENEG